MTEKTDKYAIGWSDPRATYGDPNIKWEPIRYSHRYELKDYLSWVGLAAAVSMTVAPMAWVQLFMWAGS